MEKIECETKNITNENIVRLLELFPQVTTEIKNEEGKIETGVNFSALRELLGDVAESTSEFYQFTWPGKLEAKTEAHRVIAKTFRPCPEDSVNWDSTENLYIEGNNVDALKILRDTYSGRIKTIYIDPPYNTGRNYLYKNDYSASEKKYREFSGEFDETGNRLVANPESNGRFHSDWCSSIYTPLLIAKDLLSKDGVLFCAIDENELGTLILMLKEIFFPSSYEHAYVSIRHNPRGQQGNNFSYVNEFMVIVYPKDKKKYLADFPRDEVDSRNLRDSGTESDRTDARNCFYPVLVKENNIIGFGDVPKDSFHPETANVTRSDGTVEVWPMTDCGDEKKWRYARQSVESILSDLSVKETREYKQIIFNKTTGTMKSLWVDARYDASEYGTKLVDEMLGGSSFTYPKSLWTVRDALYASTFNDPDALILDFYSGSGTTLHAAMELNKEDGGNRKTILIQVPEPCDENSDAYKLGFTTICEVAKQRLRESGKKILSEHPQDPSQLSMNFPDAEVTDVGFRVFKIDSSNMADAHTNPQSTDQNSLFEFVNNVKANRTEEDLLFEVLPKFRIPYSANIEELDIAGKKVFNVEEGLLLACFDADVTTDVIEEIAKLKPSYAVMRDLSFKQDDVLSNFEELFKTYSPDTIRRVI